VTWAEPTTKITSTITQRHTTKVGTHTHHHQPSAFFVQRTVGVGCVNFASIFIARNAVWQCVKVDRAGIFDFSIGAVTDKNRLTLP
jgi:hypothetical protein